ncbi:MAG: hypothetical protein Kow00105_00290 [Phycisphaeraceae bacterium]
MRALEAVVVLGVTAAVLIHTHRVESRANSSALWSDVLTAQRVERWYPKVGGPNAADHYVRAFEGLRPLKGLFYERHVAGLSSLSDTTAWTDRTWRHVDSMLARAGVVLAELDLAAAVHGCRFDVSVYSDGRPNLAWHHSGMRRCAKLLWLAGLADARRGRVADAVRRVSALNRIADALIEEPSLVAIAASCRVRQMACELADWLIEHHNLDDSLLRDLEQALPPYAPDLPRWVVEELGNHVSVSSYQRTLRQTAMQVQQSRHEILSRMD